MNTIQIKKHFVESEFLKSKTIPEGYQVKGAILRRKIAYWIFELSLIRDYLGFPITITDGLRLGEGTSEHFFKSFGAVDIRPSERFESYQYMQLGLVLTASPFTRITRVCYYPPSKRFPTGGFHCDCKGREKRLFINEGSEINWKHVDEVTFISRIKTHSADIKTVKS